MSAPAGVQRVATPRKMDAVEALDRVQDAVETAYNEVNSAQNKGTVLESAALVAGQVNRVAHGLGYKPKGWKITKVNGATVIYEAATSNAQFLDLVTAGSVTADIEVF